MSRIVAALAAAVLITLAGTEALVSPTRAQAASAPSGLAPAAPSDHCVATSQALRIRLASMDAALDVSAESLDATRAQLSAIAARIHEIADANLSGETTDAATNARYVALVDEYLRGAVAFEQRRAAHNDQVRVRNGLAHEINALAC
jgi:hypothetical protein